MPDCISRDLVQSRCTLTSPVRRYLPGRGSQTCPRNALGRRAPYADCRHPTLHVWCAEASPVPPETTRTDARTDAPMASWAHMLRMSSHARRAVATLLRVARALQRAHAERVHALDYCQRAAGGLARLRKHWERMPSACHVHSRSGMSTHAVPRARATVTSHPARAASQAQHETCRKYAQEAGQGRCDLRQQVRHNPQDATRHQCSGEHTRGERGKRSELAPERGRAYRQPSSPLVVP